MAEPKKRTNNAKQGMRRAKNTIVAAPNLVYCPKCHEPKERHKVCYNCGQYGETKVM